MQDTTFDALADYLAVPARVTAQSKAASVMAGEPRATGERISQLEIAWGRRLMR